MEVLNSASLKELQMFSKKLTILALFIAISISSFAQKELTNEAIWYSNTFRMGWVSGLNSMNDGLHYSSLESGEDGTSVNKYDYKTGSLVATLISPKDLVPDGAEDALSIDEYQLSADEKQMLIATEQEGIYRHSSKSYYWTVDLKSKKLTPLSKTAKSKQRLAEFSPDGSKVAFVRMNNLFYKDLKDGQEVQITFDGEMNKVINGATDWVYEEEFGKDKGFEWSPNGTKIAFFRFDESKVKEFQMAMYGDLYPNQYTFKYPKAGEENSEVQVKVYTLMSKNTTGCDIGMDPDIYIPRIQWTQSDEVLCVQKMNRHQNELEYITFRFKENRPMKDGIVPNVIYKESSKTYIEINDQIYFMKDGRFVMLSDKDGYAHIYLVAKDGSSAKQLTTGSFDVTEIKGVDESNGLVYYLSTEEGPTQQDLCSIKLNGSGKKDLTAKLGPGRSDANFSKNFKYFINYWSSANEPYRITLHDSKGKKIKDLETNEKYKAAVAEHSDLKKEFFTFTTGEGVELNGWMIKPKGFQSREQYPVFLHFYGGPGHNVVTDAWSGSNFLWHQMLAQKGYLVVSVDPRGTMYRGSQHLKCTYRQMGKLETEDMIETAKYLQTLPYVDGSRIGVQGWSYGGFLTSLCMTKGAEYFKMGIAVAPVTNWRYYDSIYTERFMRTPQENPEGYDDNSPINHVEKLEGAYLLVHGSADDNVHYQNTMEMVDALVKANKQFDLFIYPNKNHSIYGGPTRLHLYNKMTDFILENL